MTPTFWSVFAFLAVLFRIAPLDAGRLTKKLTEPSVPSVSPPIKSAFSRRRTLARPLLRSAAMEPRERYTLLGPDCFGDLDLIALILGTGAGGRTTRSIAASVLERFGGLAAVAEAPVDALASVRGVGPVRAVRLHASLALGRRSQRLPSPLEPVTTAEAAAAWFVPSLNGLLYEELHALYLNRKGNPIAYRKLTSGHDAATIVESRQILRPAVELGSAGVVLAHNHPSGDPEPSQEDKIVTRRVHSSAAILGIRLVDHLIIGGDRFISMAARGELSG